MARKRVATGIESWEGADKVLFEIAHLEREIEGLEGDLQALIEEAKQETKNAVAPLQERKKLLELQLQRFVEARREELTGKSRKLNYGTVGFRQSTRIVIRAAAACVMALKSLGLREYLRVREAPDKERLRELDDATLAQVGARRVVEEVFGYQLDRARIQEVL